MTRRTLRDWTTEELKTEIRKYESPEYWTKRKTRMSVSDNWIQSELDCMCAELGRREEC